MRSYLTARLGFVTLSTFGVVGCAGAAPGNTTADDSPSSIGATPSRSPSPASAPPLRRAYEAASVVVPVGNTCSLHPEGDLDAKQAIRVGVELDGVARFQAVRPTTPTDVGRMSLDCTDGAGRSTTYVVDLRAEATFAPREFDGAAAHLETRPALTGDPRRYTTEELIAMGYGLRPDPDGNPAGYARWLAAATVPVYQLPSAAHAGAEIRKPQSSVRREAVADPEAPSAGAVSVKPATAAAGPVKAETPTAGPTIGGSAICGNFPGSWGPAAPCYWTGAVLAGSYKKGATASATQSYVANEGTVNVPTLTPGGYSTGSTQLSIWSGLDNVFQTIVWAQATSTAANYFIDRQEHESTVANGAAGEGITFTPNANDSVFVEEWYCDASGNPNIAGGYGCTHVTDVTRNLAWDCSKANSTTCQSFKLGSGDLIGTEAEYVVENDAPQDGTTFAWPDFSTKPITMSGSALVVTGSGAGSTLTQSSGWVTVNTDTGVAGLADSPPTGLPAGSSYVNVTFPGSGSVVWTNAPATPAWATPSGTTIPIEAIQMGSDTNGLPLYACVVQHDSSIQVGKTESGWGTCDIGFGGQELWLSGMQILGTAWQSASNGLIPDQAMQVSSWTGADPSPMYSCRANVPGVSGWQVGFVTPGGWCIIGYGGKDYAVDAYQVLSNPAGVGFHGVAVPSGAAIPTAALRGGTDSDGTPLYVCVGQYENEWLPGKTRAGFNACDVGLNNVENFLTPNWVFVPTFATGSSSGPPAGAYVAGVGTANEALAICTDSYASSTQVGRAVSGGACHFGYGDVEQITSGSYQVLMSQ